MVKIAFNSALAQKALGKEAPDGEKVSLPRLLLLLLFGVGPAPAGRLQTAVSALSICASSF